VGPLDFALAKNSRKFVDKTGIRLELDKAIPFSFYCPTAFFNVSNDVIHAMRLMKSASDLL